MSARKFAAPSAPVEARFWSRVDVRSADECWLWLGWKDEGGYGHFTTAEFSTYVAHRIAYVLTWGAVPDGMVLDHLCRRRACVNPDHLEPVTSGENSRRSPLILKPECSKGHPYVEGSYYLDRGRRQCKQCKREQVADYVARTARTTASFVCEFCGETRNLTGRARHIKRWHPEHYMPRAKSKGVTPEQKERRLAQQRERRRAAREAKREGRRAS